MPKQKKVEIWDELRKVEPRTVKLDKVSLDPNNPRFERPGTEILADERIEEKGVQEECLDGIKKDGIKDLVQSIQSCGFWTVDRVVLRPLTDVKYVVVEGNRRIATLKVLAQRHKEGTITLSRQVLGGISEFEALVYTGDNPEIAWIVQGFRHTPGIKKWDDYPKAKFLSEFQKEAGKAPRDIASTLGMKPSEVAKLIRSYDAFEFAVKNGEYGYILGPEHFGFFLQIIFVKPELRDWLGWDDSKREFEHTDNLRKFLFWIEQRRINIAAITRDTLPRLIEPDHKELFEKFDQGSLTLDQCKEEIFKEEAKPRPDLGDILRNLTGLRDIIVSLPLPILQKPRGEEKKQAKQIVELLQELSGLLRQQLANLKKK